ncbi:MAG: DUF2251 domain-containing protein [Candidatus Pedobacter colombiensis]|uniref:DUF2251 domain-containing protein n=1 Tax=Candidatus Pedobacter colombiensis TaxID=3121371 RepID=A0AAJ5WB88_9SPHI|nr:DUF2251 domain-containing protein [Pedobacter sp.]WEK20471.1 MAG: DUF2251 domain-containing protein [Pedobacter sp.]
MENKPKLIIYEEQIFNVGEDTFIESTAENDNAVVFEDNGETGYFYALDRSNIDLKMLDGVHIYNVANVTDRDKPSTVKILWTVDLTKAFLSINNYYHAVFDFQNHAGYCRNGFPETNSSWNKVKERKLTDLLILELSGSQNALNH